MQIPDEVVLGADFLAELEVVDDPLLVVRPHLLVVVPVLVKHPLEVRHAFPRLDLLPYLPLQKDIPDHVLVVVAPHHHEGGLVGALDYPQFLGSRILERYVLAMVHA